jgi:hypothetical protein
MTCASFLTIIERQIVCPNEFISRDPVETHAGKFMIPEHNT